MIELAIVLPAATFLGVTIRMVDRTITQRESQGAARVLEKSLTPSTLFDGPAASFAAVLADTRWHDHPLVFALMLAVVLLALSAIRRVMDRRDEFWSRGIER